MIRIVSYEGQPAAQLLDRAAEVKRDVTQGPHPAGGCGPF